PRRARRRRRSSADLPRDRFPAGLRWKRQMAIQQKLQTKLAQKLILTPSLQQAIKLLPMSTLELADLLNQEVVENPLLEEVPTEDLTAQEQTPAEKEGGEDKTKEKTDPWDDA